jgi:hypothetical protein
VGPTTIPLDKGMIDHGSLHFTYIGAAFLSSETILELIENNLIALSFDNENMSFIYGSINKFQENVFDSSSFMGFLYALAAFLNQTRRLKTEVKVRYSLTNLVTNIAASLLMITAIPR